MARTRGKKTSKAKRYPVHRYLYFDITHSGTGEDFHYIDLAACMSAVNRRLYRQGRQYHVANATIHDSDGDADVKLSILPDTWALQAGWHMMFDAWKDQRSRVLENSVGDITGKWADFKVYMNKLHYDQRYQSAGTPGDALIPVNVEGGVANTYTRLDQEWQYSDVSYVDQDGTDFDNIPLVMLSNTTTSVVGIMDELQKSMSMVQSNSPNLSNIGKSVIFGMNPSILDTNKDLLTDIAEDNDQPPYSAALPLGSTGNPANAEPYAPWCVREFAIATESARTATTGGFAAPLGLICVETDSATSGNKIGLLLELVPGSYKGVHAEAF